MSGKCSVVVIGNGTLACRGLQTLLECVDVPLVIADSRDTGEDSWRRSLVRTAREAGFRDGETLFQPRNPNDDEVLAQIRRVNPDLILSLQCRHIIREPLFSLPRLATLNLHNAPLPLLRGCDPFGWAIHDGLKQMGVTLHRILDEGVDNGPIVCQSLWPVADDANAWDLYQEGLVRAVDMMKNFFSSFDERSVEGVSQDERFCTYHPMGQFDFSDMEINWSMVADTLSAWIRSRIFPPLQLPFFRVNDVKVDVLRCCKVDDRGVPGTVLSISPFIVAAKWGGVEMREVRVGGTLLDGVSATRDLQLQPGQQLG